MSPTRQIQDPAKRAMLLTALYIAQEQYGHLSEEAIQRVSARLGLSPTEVLSTASFYTLYNRQPSARYRIQVCAGLSCHLCDGAESLERQVRQKLGLAEGQDRTKDGRFSVETVECLAACDTAPNLRINDELFADLTPEATDALLDRLMKE